MNRFVNDLENILNQTPGAGGPYKVLDGPLGPKLSVQNGGRANVHLSEGHPANSENAGMGPNIRVTGPKGSDLDSRFSVGDGHVVRTDYSNGRVINQTSSNISLKSGMDEPFEFPEMPILGGEI